MKRDAQTTQQHAADWQGSGEPLFDDFPLLDRALADRWWEDGKAREPYTLKIALYAPGVQVTISDDYGRRSSYTTAGSIAEAFGLIERLLLSGALAWRPWGGKGR